MSDARQYPGMGQDERTSFAPYGAFEVPADLRELHGRWDVESTARRIRNFRYAEEWTMLMLGGWLATIPEIPVKTGLGKVIWETAQAADLLGHRLPELRCGRKAMQTSESPNQGFADFMQEVARPELPEQSIEKLAGVFDVLKPHLIETYENTMRQTDQIADAPTIEILEDIVRKERRHVAWGTEVLDRLCDTDPKRERRRARNEELTRALLLCGGVTGELKA
ncbi:MAG: hypothetical protein V3T07_05275 [Myxococcota bacterium]